MGIKLTVRRQGKKAGSAPFFEKAFNQKRIIIGNDEAADVRLNGSVLAAEQVIIVDGMVEPIIINCAEGTSLNEEVLAADERRSLRDGDRLRVGTYRIDISVYAEPRTPITIDESQPRNGQRVAHANDQTLSDADSGKSELVVTNAPDELPTSWLGQESIDPFRSEPERRHTPADSFAAILDGLRTDEDRFYFLIEGGPKSGTRVAIELEQMSLGWHFSGEYLTFDISVTAELLALVRKDWSGVILQPQKAGTTVNGEVVEGSRRLRDGDRISFSRRSKFESTVATQLVFHEPASLVILDTLMPRALPYEIEPSQSAQQNGKEINGGTFSPARKLTSWLKSNKEYFGAFTLGELSLMAMGTVIGAVIIFLILNYS